MRVGGVCRKQGENYGSRRAISLWEDKLMVSAEIGIRKSVSAYNVGRPIEGCEATSEASQQA